MKDDWKWNAEYALFKLYRIQYAEFALLSYAESNNALVASLTLNILTSWPPERHLVTNSYKTSACGLPNAYSHILPAAELVVTMLPCEIYLQCI